MIGADIDGRFTITHRIGSGGMGAVYAAVQRSIGRDVAIKVIHPSTHDRDNARRFLREAWLASRLTNPHIVSIHDFGQTDDGQLYMVMELVGGQTISAELRRVRRFAPIRAARVAMQIATALDAAHRSGVVHRDLKPANIMIRDTDDGDQVTVLDFGLAKSLENEAGCGITEAGIIVGTPGYVPPEIVRGEPATPSSDLYSLGAVLYTMLAGRKPFVGDELAVLRAHVLHPPARLPDTVPAPLAEVVYKLLAKSPEARYPSAVAVREALAAALSVPPPIPGVAREETVDEPSDTLEIDTDELEVEILSMSTTLPPLPPVQVALPAPDLSPLKAATAPPPVPEPRGSRTPSRLRSLGLALAFVALTIATVATGVGLAENANAESARTTSAVAN